ncbi:g3879 [Coccomyxa elongata]
MEDYEFIDKMEVEEAEPPKAVEVASSAASSTSIFHDRITHLQNLATEDDDDTDVEVTSPVATREVRVDHSLQEACNEGYEWGLDFALHQLLIIASAMGNMVVRAASAAKMGLEAAARGLKDPQVERHVRAHGASVLAACATLLLALLLVHRGNERAASGSPIGSSQVSLAKFGVGCAPLPAAVLGMVHNFTAAQRLLAEGTPSDGAIILAAYAAHASEQFEAAKRLYKKGVVQPAVHGHRAKAALKAAQKEMKQSAKWAGREVHALSKMHRRFVRRLQDAHQLDREATAQLARQLPELIRALDSSSGGGHSRGQRRLRLQRGAARPAADAAAEAAAAYDAAGRGVASAAATLEAHWGRLAPAVQAVAEGELHAWMGSWEALGTAVCVADLDTSADAALQTENCPNSAMSTLTARLRASVNFRRRLLNLSSSAQLPEEALEHYTAACQMGGGLAVVLQRVHAELASLADDPSCLAGVPSTGKSRRARRAWLTPFARVREQDMLGYNHEGWQ